MSDTRRAVLCVAASMLVGVVVAPATSLATGASAPAGASRAPRWPHPVVAKLTVGRTVSAGALPRVSVRVDEIGVHLVYVQVALVDLDSHTTPLTATLGWVGTWRVLNVAWPRGASVAAGSYQVIVSAHDPRRQALLRGPHTSGEATLTVDGPPKPRPAPTPPLAPAPAVPAAPATSGAAAPVPAAEPGVPSIAQTVAEGAVFPVAGTHNFGGPENAFGAPRAGYLHQGQDILTSEGTPIVAPLSGTILTTSYQEGGAGYYAVEHTNIGFDIMNAHCQQGSVAVSTGQAVSSGQVLCHAGQTGDATTPHVDFELWVDGWQSPGSRPINPLPYLEAWEHDGAAGAAGSVG